MARKNKAAVASGTKAHQDPILIELADFDRKYDSGHGWTTREFAQRVGLKYSSCTLKIREMYLAGQIEVVGRRPSVNALGKINGISAEYRMVKR